MKNIKFLLVLLLTLALSLSLFACTGGGDCEHIDDDGDKICDECGEELEEGDSPDGALVLVDADGEPKFQIVKGSDFPVASRMFLDKLVGNLDKAGVTLNVVDDKASTVNDDVIEVLFGTVSSRGDAYKYDKYTLGDEGYTIHALDNKIIVTGGSEKALSDAITEFFEDVLGIKNADDPLTETTFTKESEIHKPQTDYRVSDVTVNGVSVRDGYTIVVDDSVNVKFTKPLQDAAQQLHDYFYKQVGIYLEVIDESKYDGKANAIILRGTEKGKAGSKGFRVKLEDNCLVIEGAHHNMFADAFSSYYNSALGFAQGETLALKEADSKIDTTRVYYSDFGAKGDGKTDDYAAIKAAHEFANEGGQKVYGDKGKTYYLYNIPAFIYIKTDVNWNGATFIIDDSSLTDANNKNINGINVTIDNGLFEVVQDVENTYATKAQLEAVKALIGDDGFLFHGLESKGELTTNVGLALGYEAVLTLTNANKKNYFRYGYVDTKGQSQQEIVLVDKDGNIDKSTPLLHDYTDITSIRIHRTDTTPITIENATIHHIASRVNLVGGYYSIGRNIEVKRANVTLKNLTHEISGEIPKNQPVTMDANGLAVIAEGYTYSSGKILDPDGKTYTGNDIKPFTGHSYGGFIAARNTHNTQVENCVFQARVYYEEGTYDISAGLTNQLVFTNCNQSNFFEEDGKTVNMSKCWGVAGTNYCKNMEYINCNFTRYDAHAGVTNGKIIGGSLAVLRLIGGGEFIMEGVTVYARNGGAPFQLRSDYGSSFNGTLTIKDCTIECQNFLLRALISAPTAYWDMGYETFFPSVIIDNFKINTTAKQGDVLLISQGTVGYSDSGHYPGREIFKKDPNDPTTKGYQFHWETADAEAWIAENIEKEGSRFFGCEYEVKDHGKTYTVIVTDVKNQYLYHAPDFIKIINNKDNGYKILVCDCDFIKDTIKNTDTELEKGAVELVPAKDYKNN